MKMFIIYLSKDKSEAVMFSEREDARLAAGCRHAGAVESTLADFVNDTYSEYDGPLEICEIDVPPTEKP